MVDATTPLAPSDLPLTDANATKPPAVASTSDERTVNNIMRHAYRVLGDDEKAAMQELKDLGLQFVTLLHKIGNTAVMGEKYASRELSVAGTKCEEAVMWAVKHITK